MPTCEIIAIGTELLLGEIQDTNSAYIASCLRSLGVDLFRTQVVGDNPQRVAEILLEAAARADILICTGGLGPTVDDPTRAAVSLALREPLVFRPELWQTILGYFRRIDRDPPENNKIQANLPPSAQPIPNPHGTAPGIQVKIGAAQAYFLPGVPREMEEMLTSTVLPDIERLFPTHQVLVTRVLHTAGIGEARLDQLIEDYERSANPTVGLAAHPGTVDIRISAKADNPAEAISMIAKIDTELRFILGISIYGVDDETLLDAFLASLPEGEKPTLVCVGWPEAAAGLIKQTHALLLETLPTAPNEPLEDFLRATAKLDTHQTIFYSGVSHPANVIQLDFGVLSGGMYNFHNRKYGGPTGYTAQWILNTTLNFMREHLLKNEDE